MSLIDEALQQAKNTLACYFPLQSMIAVNPYWDLTHIPFKNLSDHLDNYTMGKRFYLRKFENENILKDHVHQAREQILRDENDDIQKRVREQLFIHHIESTASKKILYSKQIKEFRFQKSTAWVSTECQTFLRDFFASRVKVNNKEKLLDAWHESLAKQEQHLYDCSSKTKLIENFLHTLGVPQSLTLHYCIAIYKRLYGWGSYIKWAETHPDNPWIKVNTSTEDILILWLYHETIIHRERQSRYNAPNIKQSSSQKVNNLILHIWQKAYELSYQQALVEKLKRQIPQKQKKPPALQAIFCIDTRSEGLRRHLEAVYNCETFGFAGFFGFVFKTTNNDEHTCHQCPAILEPDKLAKLSSTPPSHWHKISQTSIETISNSKNTLLSPFAIFEIFGCWMVIKLLMKSLLPTVYQRFTQQNKTQFLQSAKAFTAEQDHQFLAASAASLLATIGLRDHFAKTVMITSHSSTSDNNPFAASLDCGACGGNGGAINAAIAAEALNQPEVRILLKEKHGINIPDDTRFISADHNTTLDQVTLLNDNIPALQAVLDKACNALRKERRQQLPGNSSCQRRASDWSELIPELGLASNAALIIGPRDYSRGVDLERRVFLHSYDPTQDPNGYILDAIFKGPLTVAHWINSQYYFSTVKSDQFSAGNKTIHNVIPGIGVMSGNLSDLKIGLPEQSIFFQQKLVHKPLRLFVIIHANRHAYNYAMQQNPKIAQIVENGWIDMKWLESNS